LIIRNRDELLRVGNITGRTLVLDILEHAVQEVSYRKLVDRLTHLNDKLTIGSKSYDLKDTNIYVLGAGKQVSFMAAALENILGERIREGVVIEKEGWGCSTRRIRTVKGGHPLPDEQGVEGAREIVRIAGAAGNEDTLVIVCVSGGCTALATLPPSNVGLQDVRSVFESLLNVGAPIEDQNTVRKHLSQLGEGKLSVLLRNAQTVGLIAVDEVSSLPWGPTVPDTTTFSDAIRILQKYRLWNKTPESIQKYFLESRPDQETPKANDFTRLNLKCDNFVLANNDMLCKAAENKARELNLNTNILSTQLEGGAKSVGTVLGSIGLEIENKKTPLAPPCAIIAGGETTVTIDEDSGEGGRNQELALSAALKIAGSKKIVIASLGTDGSDGPTDIAGAIVDGYTATLAEASRLDIFKSLKRHDSASVCRGLRNAIYTNDTETNLMDLMIVCVC
jgi:glycerate 2-kinase